MATGTYVIISGVTSRITNYADNPNLLGGASDPRNHR